MRLNKIGKFTVLNLLATVVIVVASFFIFSVLLKDNLFINFVKDAENKTLDYRQEILSNKKNTFLAKENIAIVTIDDVSFEYLCD